MQKKFSQQNQLYVIKYSILASSRTCEVQIDTLPLLAVYLIACVLYNFHNGQKVPALAKFCVKISRLAGYRMHLLKKLL